jgi:hypothetical protein
MFTIFATIAITAVLTVIVTAGFCYLYLLCPAQQQTRLYRNRAVSLSEQLDLLRKSRATLVSEQQADLHTLQSDLTKWVEHECTYHKAPAVGDALNQRIKERPEVLLSFQKRRETQAQ